MRGGSRDRKSENNLSSGKLPLKHTHCILCIFDHDNNYSTVHCIDILVLLLFCYIQSTCCCNYYIVYSNGFVCWPDIITKLCTCTCIV